MSRKTFCVQHFNCLTGLWRKAVFLAVCLVFLSATADAGKAPMTEKAVPVFPGAKPDKEAEANMGEEPYDGSDDVTGVKRLRSSFRKGYSTTATPEEVFEHYKKKLSAVEREGYEYEDLAPGSASRIAYEIVFYDFDKDPAFGCEYNCEEWIKDKKASRKKVKSLLVKNRKPYGPEKWIGGASFSWYVKESNGDDTYFEVSIGDVAISDDTENPSYTPRTFIHVRRETEKSQEAFNEEVSEEGWRQNEKEHEKKRAALAAGKVLKPEDMGVSTYQGAKYEADATRFIRETLANDGVAYATNDSIKKVAEFYKAQDGLELIGMTEEGAWFKRCEKEYNRFLKQTMNTNNCDLEITVQNPWLAKIGGKKNKSTLITFVRMEQESVDEPQADGAAWEEPGEDPEKGPEKAPLGGGHVPDGVNKLKNLFDF